MEALIAIVAIVLLITPLAVIYLLFKVGSLSGKLYQSEQINEDLSNRLSKLEQKLKNFGQSEKSKSETQPAINLPDRNTAKLPELPAVIEQEPELLTEESNKDLQTPQEESIVVVGISEHLQEHSEQKEAVVLTATEQNIKTTSTFWERLSGENWIGVVGSVLLVIGAIFLITYAALQVEPVYRFAIITAFSLITGGIGFALRTNPEWSTFGSWLRSVGGALFLFGSLGSGYIPGLQWIDNPATSLAVLSLGISVNLLLGFLGGTQVFASLHVLLSLTALALAPATNQTLILAAIVTLFGIAPVYRERWDAHLLIIVVAFFTFHLYWYFTIGKLSLMVMYAQPLLSISIWLILGIVGAIVHYRSAYTSNKFEVLPFLGHLFNWLFMATGLAMHAAGTPYKTIFILIGAIAAFVLALRAKKIGIKWLYYTDTLLAQVAMLVALLTLTDWSWTNDNEITVLSLMFLEALLFSFVMMLVKEQWLYRTGLAAVHLLGVGLIVLAGTEIFSENFIGNYLHAGFIAIALAASLAFQIYPAIFQTETSPFDTSDSWFLPLGSTGKDHRFSVLGLLSGIMPLVIFTYFYDQLWAVYTTGVLFIVLLYLRNKLQINGFGIGLLAGLVLWHYIVWQTVFYQESWTQIFSFVFTIPLLAVSFVAALWCFVASSGTYLRWPGMYLFVLGASFTAYHFLEPIWVFAPPLFWIAGSVILLEMAKWFRNNYGGKQHEEDEPDRYLLQLGYILLLVFVVRHFTEYITIEESIGFFKTRWIVELTAFIALLYWAFQQPVQSGEKNYPVWKFIQPLMPEILLGFTIGITIVEVPEIWHSLLFVILALSALVITVRQQDSISRLRLYALMMSWISAGFIVYISHFYITNTMYWTAQPWLAGVASIILLFVFVAFYYPYRQLDNLSFPALLHGVLSAFVQLIRRRSMWWIFYPIFISVAVFLYYSFSKSVLTLWWVIECFVIFSLAFWARENYFRYIAFTGVLICLFRLVLFDLAQTGTLTRALAFLGMGAVLLAMYVVGNRFKGRFEHENSISTKET